MSIRREDKEFIQSLAILGALLGFCIGSFMIMHLSDRAHKTYAQQSEYLQTQQALIKLSTTTVTPNNPIASQEVLEQVKQQMEKESVDRSQEPKSFWLTISRMGLWGLCGVGGAAGAITGYAAIWLTAWAGSIFVYQFLRSLYDIIRKAAPNCEAAEIKSGTHDDGTVYYQRNDKRILPAIVKLLFFLLLVFVLLTLVVWHLTNL